MSFDAFMVRGVAAELNERLSGARVEKVLQPSKDEIFLVLHKGSEHFRLQINAGAQTPRIGITAEAPENPKAPPMLCMLLRKHLTGAKLDKVIQRGFERVIEIELETYDEMGFFTKRRLIAEIMGRYSNAILCDDEYRILGAVRPVDFTTSSKRQVLAGMMYELPPSQDKRNPILETKEEFFSALEGVDELTDKTVTEIWSGFSPLTARELVHRARCEGEITVSSLWGAFESLVKQTNDGNFAPTLLLTNDGRPKDFSCFEITHSIESCRAVRMADFGALTDGFFAENERRAREKSRAYATERLLKNIESRLEKKLAIQKKELADTEKRAEYKQKADLITANIYRFNGKNSKITVIDYVDDGNGGYTEKEVEISLENGMTAPAAAQKLYKKYAKAKNAEREISAQIEKGEAELKYIRSVLDALSRVSGQAELDEIRAELTEMGYIKAPKEDKKKHTGKNPQKKQIGQPHKFTTVGGFTVLVGKNNLQNDYLTLRLASKSDYWFHTKNIPGSHTVLLCDGKEPSDADLTEAAILAARHSKASEQDRAEVDYTRIKNVKKPSGARPGFVIYDNYKTTVVSLK